MDYKKIKAKLIEVQDMLSEIPQDCKGSSDEARSNRLKYIKVKFGVRDLIDSLL